MDVLRAWRAVADAVAPDTRMFIIEKLLEAGKPSAYGAAQDLFMMMFGGSGAVLRCMRSWRLLWACGCMRTSRTSLMALGCWSSVRPE